MSPPAERLTFALLGLLLGLFIVGGVTLAISSKSNTVEVIVEVETMICPPIILEAKGMTIGFGEGADTELTDLDREFEEACDLDWGPVIPVLPVEPGASPTSPASSPTDPIDSEPVSPQPEDESA